MGTILVLERDDATMAMVECGAREVFLELLMSHWCEETAARHC